MRYPGIWEHIALTDRGWEEFHSVCRYTSVLLIHLFNWFHTLFIGRACGIGKGTVNTCPCSDASWLQPWALLRLGSLPVSGSLSSWVYDALCCVPWEMKPQHGTVRGLVFGKEPLWAFGITLQFLLMPGFPHPGLLLGNACVWILSLERRVFWEVSGCAVPADFSGFSEWSLASGPWFLAPWAVSQSVCLQRHLSPFRSDLTMQINLKINRDHPHLLICCVGSILEEVWINRNCCLPSAGKSVDWCRTWQIMRSLGKSLFSKFQKIDLEVQGGVFFFFFHFVWFFFFLAFACLFILFIFFWASATPIIFLNGLCKHARWERIGGGSSSSWNW